jgi:hypothetical protein
MFDAGDCGVACQTKLVRQRLRLQVIGDDHRDIDVARKPHFSTNGDSEAADQCETAA